MALSHRIVTSETSCLAVDLGAGSCRLVLGTLGGSGWKLQEIGRFATPSRMDPLAGCQFWDIDAIADQLAESVNRARGVGMPASLGVDGWGVDYVLLDEQFDVVGRPVCYRDKRTAGVMKRVLKKISREEIYRRTGIQFLPFNTLYQLAACVEQQPDWIGTAEHFLMIPDYLHYRFSGVLSNEYTNASTTQMCGPDGEWDTFLMDAIGLKRSLMRTPVAAATVLGDGIGIARGLKIIAPATHDTGSAVAGTPMESEDEAYISSGTWSLMGVESANPIVTADALAMNFTNEGGLERRFRVLKNVMGMWLVQRVCEEAKISDYGALMDEAAGEQPWRSILDANDPEFLNPPSMTESIRSYCRGSGQPEPETAAQMARCIVDSLALCYRKVKQELERLRGRKITRIRIVGGGCQNRLLSQLCADACEVPVSAGPVEASVLGNLSAQMIALGALADLNAARSLITATFEVREYFPQAKVPEHALARFEQLLAAKDSPPAKFTS